MKDVLILDLAEARRRAGRQDEAPAIAAALRSDAGQALCLVDGGKAWVDTPHARGWLADVPQDVAAFAAAVQAARARGFVAANALIVATMKKPHALPALSWGEELPQTAQSRVVTRRLDLYAVVDSAERLRQVLAANVRTVQLRIKTPLEPDAGWHAMLRREVGEAIADCRAAGAELFVNDHWRLARELGASGVHLGQEDLLALGEAGRRELRESGLALGISSHSLWELARARTLSPRYIACGPVWPTTTKDMPWVPQGLDNLAWWRLAAGVPVTAIGGILTPAEVQQAARTGVDGVCIVRGLGDDPRRTVPAFEAALAAGRDDPMKDLPAWPHPTLPAAG